MNSGYNRMISTGAIVALGGYLLSGPASFILVHLLKPQPPWTSPEVFVKNYSLLQDLPFYFGFFLVGGMLMLSAGHYLAYDKDHPGIKFQLLVSLGLTIVFCALISFNYISQTTFVHNMALHYRPEIDSAISTFSMSNPLSFCWANEMWGYCILGIANIFMAGYYVHENISIRVLLILNGIISVGSALWTIFDVSWVMTLSGLIAYFAWNVLMIAMMILIHRHARMRKLNTNEAD